MTSTKVTSPGAGARETARGFPRERPRFIPPGRDPRGRGRCLYPGCPVACEKYVPTCGEHWRNTPDVLAQAIRDGWRAKDLRRWLLACEALRLYWHAVAP